MKKGRFIVFLAVERNGRLDDLEMIFESIPQTCVGIAEMAVARRILSYLMVKQWKCYNALPFVIGMD